MRALNAEIVKLFTTRLWLWQWLTIAVLTGGLSFLIWNDIDDLNGPGFNKLQIGDLAETMSLMAPIAYIIAATFGIIGLTGEYRHMTVTPTFLATPQRPVVVLAKLVFYTVIGGISGLLFAVIFGGVSFQVLGGKGYDISMSNDLVSDALYGVVIVSALFGLFGVGVGTLLRNQVFAVTGTVLYLFVIENIFIIVPGIQDVYPYLPGGAAKIIMYEGLELPEGVDALTAGQSTIVLIAWALGLAVLGSVITLSRDVT